jgi:hypothetical protein
MVALSREKKGAASIAGGNPKRAVKGHKNVDSRSDIVYILSRKHQCPHT